MSFLLYGYRYEQSLSVLKHAKHSKEGLITKTSIMLGLGETDDEVKEAMADLRAIDVDIVTFGQYLQVSYVKYFNGFHTCFSQIRNQISKSYPPCLQMVLIFHLIS